MIPLANSTKDNKWNIPANVTTSVRIAQYLSIFVALLMEEEVSSVFVRAYYFVHIL